MDNLKLVWDHSLSWVVVPATLHNICQRSFYKIFVKFRNSKKNVLKIVLILVNINKDENKSLISNQFSLKNDPPLHFLENYFAEVKIKKLKQSEIIFKRELIWNEWCKMGVDRYGHSLSRVVVPATLDFYLCQRPFYKSLVS